MGDDQIKKIYGQPKSESVFKKLERLRRDMIALNLHRESDGDLVRKVYPSTSLR